MWIEKGLFWHGPWFALAQTVPRQRKGLEWIFKALTIKLLAKAYFPLIDLEF